MEGRITPETNLNELLSGCPALIPLFIKKQLACVGCLMAKFETVSDLSRNYNLDIANFISEMEKIMITTDR